MTFHFRATTLPIVFTFHGFRTRISIIILAAAVHLVFALYCICTDGHLEHCGRIWITGLCRGVLYAFFARSQHPDCLPEIRDGTTVE